MKIQTRHQGANIADAFKALAEVGITVKSLAADLELHPSTVYRWRSGTRSPNARNFTALRNLVDFLLAETLAGNTIADADQGEQLRAAKDALTTDAERAEQERLVADLRDHLKAAIVARHPRSITATVDPFALTANQAADAIDDAFPIAA